jgi:hypothetical protein
VRQVYVADLEQPTPSAIVLPWTRRAPPLWAPWIDAAATLNDVEVETYASHPKEQTAARFWTFAQDERVVLSDVEGESGDVPVLLTGREAGTWEQTVPLSSVPWSPLRRPRLAPSARHVAWGIGGGMVDDQILLITHTVALDAERQHVLEEREWPYLANPSFSPDSMWMTAWDNQWALRLFRLGSSVTLESVISSDCHAWRFS